MCRPVVPKPQTTASKMSETRVCGHTEPVGRTADGVPVTGRCRLLVNCAVGRGASWPGQRTSRTLSGVCNFTARPRGRPPCRQTHTTWAAKSAARCLSSGAQAVARQLRRLAIELADLDRQLDEIEQSER